MALMELATARVEEAFLAFELDLLRESGYLPETSACVRLRRGAGPARSGLLFAIARGDRLPILRRSDARPHRPRPATAGLLQTILGCRNRTARSSASPVSAAIRPTRSIESSPTIFRHQLGRGLRMTGYVL